MGNVMGNREVERPGRRAATRLAAKKGGNRRESSKYQAQQSSKSCRADNWHHDSVVSVGSARASPKLATRAPSDARSGPSPFVRLVRLALRSPPPVVVPLDPSGVLRPAPPHLGTG